jgi:hypothetical protein
MEKDVDYIGCCGAYCKTCKPFIEGHCKGCKLGYSSGKRAINKSKCKIKLCCFRDEGYTTCADCSKLEKCEIANAWYSQGHYKNKKYKEAIEFIKKNGYKKFLKSANKWKNAYGKLD